MARSTTVYLYTGPAPSLPSPAPHSRPSPFPIQAAMKLCEVKLANTHHPILLIWRRSGHEPSLLTPSLTLCTTTVETCRAKLVLRGCTYTIITRTKTFHSIAHITACQLPLRLISLRKYQRCRAAGYAAWARYSVTLEPRTLWRTPSPVPPRLFHIHQYAWHRRSPIHPCTHAHKQTKYPHISN